MSFDQKAYLADVLKPLARDKVVLADIQQALRELQGYPDDISVVARLDLMKLLAVPADLGGLSAHIASLGMFLNKRQVTPAARLLSLLVADLKARGHDLTSPEFWKQMQAAQADVLKTKLADFGAAVSLEHQALRVITTEQLTEKANANGLLGAVPEQVLMSAVANSGIAVRPDFNVPTTWIPRVISELDRFTEYRSIVDVLLFAEPEKAESIRVIDDLRYGPGGAPITMAKIDAAQKAVAVDGFSDACLAAAKALTVVRADFADPASLQQLVLASFVAKAKEMLARGELLASALVKLVKFTGIDEVDAARILLKLSDPARRRNLADVTNLVADGALADARRLFDAIASVDQFGEAEVRRVATILSTAESKEAAAATAHEVLGIDLGTTYSAVARINDLDYAEIVKNANGEDTTPSIVYFDSGVAIVGSETKSAFFIDPDNGCALIKRHMGTVFPQEFGGKTFTPESISALILKEIVKDANVECGSDITKIAIAVPAYFGAREKEATKQAGEMAGLEVVGLIPEPVAAALSIGIPSRNRETVVVYDLGGGTFDATVLVAEQGNVEVLALDGNRVLGGADWDAALARLVIDKFVTQAGIADVDPADDPDFYVEIAQEVEAKKRMLTRKRETVFRCRFEGCDEKVAVTRDEFVAVTAHLMQQTVEITQRVIETAKAKSPGLVIDKLMLVGGASRMPMVDEALRAAGFDPIPTDYDLSVAMGAAIYGQTIGICRRCGDCDQNATVDRAEVELLAAAPKQVLSRPVGIELTQGDVTGGLTGRLSFVAHAGQELPFDDTLQVVSAAHQGRVRIRVFHPRASISPFDQLGSDSILKEVEISNVLVPRRSAITLRISIADDGLAEIEVSEPMSGLEFSLHTMVGGVVLS